MYHYILLLLLITVLWNNFILPLGQVFLFYSLFSEIILIYFMWFCFFLPLINFLVDHCFLKLFYFTTRPSFFLFRSLFSDIIFTLHYITLSFFVLLLFSDFFLNYHYILLLSITVFWNYFILPLGQVFCFAQCFLISFLHYFICH